ncbi:MAG: hypothetical protein KAJ28_10505, partial [Flavobacteriaceae bacterium]|nr:hypothetical protein [Flavobacteriaceae bacterium]
MKSIAGFAVVMLFLLSANNLQAQVVDIDGNPFEWGTLQITTLPTHDYVHDPSGGGVVDNQFTEGSKDFMDAGLGTVDHPQHLVWAWGQTKAKNDIENAAAVVIQNPVLNDTLRSGSYLFFAGDRRSTNGDAQIGFWFYLNGTGAVMDEANGGYFTPEHAAGDLLILSDFTAGGDFATVTVYEWVGFGNGDSGPDLQLDLREDIGAEVAINNKQVWPVPTGWTYGDPTYALNAFYEGFVDLSGVLGDTDFCSASWLLETRSSQELTASLDDFAGGTFDLTPTAQIFGADITCGDESTTLTAITTPAFGGFGVTYTWYKALNPPTLDPDVDDFLGNGETYNATGPGTYYLIVSNQGCTTASAPLVINETPLDDLIVDCPDDVTVDCTNLSGAFTPWLEGFSTSGGANPNVVYTATVDGNPVDFAQLSAPADVCAGAVITVTLQVTDDCDQDEQCSSTFTLTADTIDPVFDQ